MKKFYRITTAIALLALAACAKQEIQDEIKGEEKTIQEENIIVLTAKDGETTKSEIAGKTAGNPGKFTWESTDRIAVHTTAGYKLSGTASVDGEDAGIATFTVDKGAAETALDYYAIYPHTLVFDDEGNVIDETTRDNYGNSNLVVNLPGSYNLADILGNKSPVPAIASIPASGDLAFYQLGALLRITLNNLPPSTRSVTLDFNGVKVQGQFTIALPVLGTSQITTATTTGTDDVITINIPAHAGEWYDGKVVNIPVPVPALSEGIPYTQLTVKSWTEENGGGNCTLQMTRWIKVKAGVSSNWIPARKGAREVIASLPAFSVNSTERVAFAPGNLYWNGSAWKFHSEQYGATFGTLTADFAGETSADREDAFKATSNRDLFQWAEMTGGITGKSIDFGTINGYKDWKLGDNFTLTITSGLSTRANRYVKITLPSSKGFPDFTETKASGETAATTWGGTPGLFIFPDNWDSSLLTSHMSSNVILNYKSAHYNTFDPKMTAEIYRQLISAGAIFLPAPGMMSGSVVYTPTQGGTWTCNEGTGEAVTRAYCCFFNNDGFSHNSLVGKTQYRTVRLVRDPN